ncbi:uncharacterized protein EI90DRAFT_3069505 [Cantharellus anzutake]|uniref:uncharacterized protein n=1 Tax=Cantharellus anzutake TaxID=1750568 RepID=UPI001903C548|nr:uncharacterized protein EI90DRAFT_3069505 [Cantharellus anzutake]KAF8326522.1 hypothetical protein EI90DRAFT_3069505 [Cantharellus anzutake]
MQFISQLLFLLSSTPSKCCILVDSLSLSILSFRHHLKLASPFYHSPSPLSHYHTDQFPIHMPKWAPLSNLNVGIPWYILISCAGTNIFICMFRSNWFSSLHDDQLSSLSVYAVVISRLSLAVRP